MNPWPYPARVAHRGAGKLAPENTLAALRRGAEFDYRMFEFDVKLSADNALVLMHDPLLNRTTNASGRLAAATLADLARIDAGSWHSAQYAGESVPTLERVAAWLRANDYLANIEIKPCPGREAQTGAAVALEVRHLWRDAPALPLLSSFSVTALEKVRAHAPELPRALLFHVLPEDWLEQCLALGCVAVDTHYATLSPEVIARAHEAGLRVVAYTVNDPERAEQLFGWGLDMLITDAIDHIKP